MSKTRRPPGAGRWNLLSVMAVIALIAAGFSGLKTPAPLVASLAFTVTTTALMVAPLLAIYRRPRHFWVGFSVVGWIYALLAFAPGAWTETRPYLLTSQVLDHASVFFGYLDIGRPASMLRAGTSPASAGLSSFDATDEGINYQRIGHALATLIHGTGGGLLAVVLAGRAASRASREAVPS